MADASRRCHPKTLVHSCFQQKVAVSVSIFSFFVCSQSIFCFVFDAVIFLSRPTLCNSLQQSGRDENISSRGKTINNQADRKKYNLVGLFVAAPGFVYTFVVVRGICFAVHFARLQYCWRLTRPQGCMPAGFER
jgi:hypothetical protein